MGGCVEFDHNFGPLSKLIRAGTVLRPSKLSEDAWLHLPIPNELLVAEDGWTAFSLQALRMHLPEPDPFPTSLEFLLKEKLIRATYRFQENRNQVALRIYLIPFDLDEMPMGRTLGLISPLASQHMQFILSLVSKNSDAWNGNLSSDSHQNPTPDLLPLNNVLDNRSLSDIFGDIQSPSPACNADALTLDLTSRLLDFNDKLDGFGLRTTLYQYQRRTVAAMIQKEMDKREIPDPLFLTLFCYDDEPFFVQPTTMEVRRKRPMVHAGKGGILCEELGTGKTVMTLTLVLATVNQLATPEESGLEDPRPILTPLSFRHFSTPEAKSARIRFFHNAGEVLPGPNSHTPTLAEQLLHLNRVRPDTRICQPGENDDVELLAAVKKDLQWRRNTPFYHHYPTTTLPEVDRMTRNASTRGAPRVIYLTSATLIVVPANLIGQWKKEIHKHASYPLRILVLTAGKQAEDVPCAVSLASDYDIILMSYTRELPVPAGCCKRDLSNLVIHCAGFSQEGSTQLGHNNPVNIESWALCQCPTLPGTRIPDCQCRFARVSPLLQVRWKRMVIDEGHVAADTSTNLVHFTGRLSVERKWIVTGTPTSSLSGLGPGAKVIEEVEDETANHKIDSIEDNVDTKEVLFRSPSQSPFNSHSPRGSETLHAWTKEEQQDLIRLGKMMRVFLAIPRFTANSKTIKTLVIDPLVRADWGAVAVLLQVMEAAMLRHRISDVEAEVILPPSTHDHVLLDMDYHAVKTYNAQQALLAVHVVDVERSGSGYIFHPKNADSLQLAIRNLSQSLFWRSESELLDQVKGALDGANETSRLARQRQAPQADLDLLSEAFRHLAIAASDDLWKALQQHRAVAYRVNGLPDALFNTWTRTPQHEVSTSNFARHCQIMHADRLLEMVQIVKKRPTIREVHLIEEGTKAPLAVKELRPAKEIRIQLEGAIEEARRAGEEPEEEMHPTSFLSAANRHYPTLYQMSLLKGARLGPTMSTKLNYIINEVKAHSLREKYLIFSSSPLTLDYISVALELLEISFLKLTASDEVQLRDLTVVAFEASNNYRILLTELPKQGARGLNLISASRIIFCEPVVRADIEIQAIKRAHRLGQQRPVTVKTLAIRNTVEQAMLDHRKRLRDGPTAQKDSGNRESIMRYHIENPKFLDHAGSCCVEADLPLVPRGTETGHLKRSRAVAVEEMQPSTSGSLPKKRRLQGTSTA